MSPLDQCVEEHEEIEVDTRQVDMNGVHGIICHEVRLLLEALGIAHERRRFDLWSGETRTTAFRALNPRGQVPVLVDDGLVLPESNAILVHLAERFAPERAGRGTAARAEVMLALEVCQKSRTKRACRKQ